MSELMPIDVLDEVASLIPKGDEKVLKSEGDRVVSIADLGKNREIRYWPKQETRFLFRPPQETLDQLKTPQDCLEFISSSLLPEHKALVDNEIEGVYMGDYRAADFSIGANPEYQRFYNEYFIPALDKLGSFKLEPNEQERVMQSMVAMYSKFTSYDTYSEDTFLLLSKHMLQNGGAQAFPHISAMYERYYEEVSPHLIQAENMAESFLSSCRIDGINSSAGALPGRLALLLAGETKYGSLSPEEAVEFSIGFVDRYPYGSLQTFSDAVESMGVENSVPILLRHLSNENEQVRRFVAETLYRLELGKVGVSEKGVEYLGKIYDLLEFNNDNLFVRRLNNSGLMAVLSEDGGNIEGVFSLNLPVEEQVIQAEVRQLMSQELFLPKADETEQQRQLRNEYLKLFVDSYESIFNDNFFKDTGVRLNSLDLHEQGWFLMNYLELSKQGNERKLERLKEFIKEYSELGLKSFLSLEYGGSGEDILDFVENGEISKEEKISVFKNFYRISNEALNWRNIFQKVEAGLDYKFSAEAYEAFLRKNSEYLKATQIISRGDSGDISLQELLSNMSSVANSLRVLNGFYNNEVSLKLDGKPSTHDEYSDDGRIIKEARKSWKFINATGEIINLTIRNKKTREGEPRINFKITDPKTKVSTRIGFDLSYFGVRTGKSESPSVSLDLGVLDPRFEPVDYLTESVGRVLSVVEGSEGGHNESSFRPEAFKYFEIIANSFAEYINRNFSS